MSDNSAGGMEQNALIYIYWASCKECGYTTAMHGPANCPDHDQRLVPYAIAGAVVDDEPREVHTEVDRGDGPRTDGGSSESGTEHERGQRHGDVETCDYDGCESTEFNVVCDRLTDSRLVVCVSCGFTMGYFAREVDTATNHGGDER